VLVDSQPHRVSSVVFAVLRKLHPSKSVTSNAASSSRRAIRPECAPTVQTSRPFASSAARPAGRSSSSRARHRAGWRTLARSGVATLRGPASPSSLRAHPSRHGADTVSCRLLLRFVHEYGRGRFSPKARMEAGAFG
jgi:hypothetical protein